MYLCECSVVCPFVVLRKMRCAIELFRVPCSPFFLPHNVSLFTRSADAVAIRALAAIEVLWLTVT